MTKHDIEQAYDIANEISDKTCLETQDLKVISGLHPTRGHILICIGVFSEAIIANCEPFINC